MCTHRFKHTQTTQVTHDAVHSNVYLLLEKLSIAREAVLLRFVILCGYLDRELFIQKITEITEVFLMVVSLILNKYSLEYHEGAALGSYC